MQNRSQTLDNVIHIDVSHFDLLDKKDPMPKSTTFFTERQTRLITPKLTNVSLINLARLIYGSLCP